jgi:ribosomal 50S subunit-recycling heat shock protein
VLAREEFSATWNDQRNPGPIRVIRVKAFGVDASHNTSVRVDLALKRLLLVRSRSEGKEACDVGAVHVNGKPAKAAQEVRVGDRIRVDYAHRTVEVELIGDIGKSVSRADAKTLYRVLRDEKVS